MGVELMGVYIVRALEQPLRVIYPESTRLQLGATRWHCNLLVPEYAPLGVIVVLLCDYFPEAAEYTPTTQWSREEMDYISQTTFSNVFSSKCLNFDQNFLEVA